MVFEDDGPLPVLVATPLPLVIPRVKWAFIWLAGAGLRRAPVETLAPCRTKNQILLFLSPLISQWPALAMGRGWSAVGIAAWADRLLRDGVYSVRYINNNK